MIEIMVKHFFTIQPLKTVLIEAMKLLLNYGASIVDKYNDGKAPFQQAISENNIETVNLLLEYPSN